MSSRLHGKMVPLPSGKTETCPYCLRQYKKVRVVEKLGKTQKLCPFCNNVLSGLQGLQAKVKSAVRKVNPKVKTKRKSATKRATTKAKSKKK